MKTKQLMIATCIAAVYSLSTSASAALFSGLDITDINGDGVITSEEVQSAFSDFQDTIVSTYDADGDGSDGGRGGRGGGRGGRR